MVAKDDVPKQTPVAAVCSLLDQIVFQRDTGQRKRKRSHETETAEVADEDASGTIKRDRRETASPALPSIKDTAETETDSTAATPTPSRRGWLQKARLRKEETASPTSAAGVVVSVIASPASRKRLGYIQLERYRDLTFQTPHESRVSVVGFVNGEVAYSAGVDKCIKIYHLSANEQVIQHTVHVKNTPVYASCLSTSRKSLINVSDDRKLFTLDLESRTVSKCPLIPGSHGSQAFKTVATRDSLLSVLDDRGRIYLLDERTFRTVKIFNSGTSIKSMAMSNNKIYSGDDGGEVFEWDLRMGRCSNRYVVEGSLGVRSLALTSNNRLVAGTNSGYVSLYDLDGFNLVKSFGNLCTATDVIASSSQIPIVLGGSSIDKDAVRLFNVGETPFVYQNFPGEMPRIQRITSAAFSDCNNWMALGNDRGIVKLWKLPASL